MTQTLLIENNEQRKTMYSLNLNVFVGTDVVAKNNHFEAINLLKVHPSVDLIICRSTIGEDNTAEEVYNFLQKEVRKIPLLVLGQGTRSKWGLDYIDPDSDIKTFIGQVARTLGVTASDLMEKPVPQLYPIPISYFLTLDRALCDIYLRLRSNEREDRYIKRFQGGDSFSTSALYRYIGYGESNLYIPSDLRLQFTKKYTAAILEQLRREDLSVPKRVQITEKSVDYVSKNIVELPMDEDTITLTQETISSILKILRDSPTLETLFKGLMANQSGFYFKQAQICTFLSRHILKTMNWWTLEQMQKLAMVAFFHDILINQEKLLRIRNLRDLEASRLTHDEKTMVLKHAYLTAELIKKIPQVPMDVELVVKQHHGAFGGMGFPDKYGGNISPLAMIFVVAEDFTHVLLQHQGPPPEMEKVLFQLKAKYNHFKYIPLVDSLKTLPF